VNLLSAVCEHREAAPRGTGFHRHKPVYPTKTPFHFVEEESPAATFRNESKLKQLVNLSQLFVVFYPTVSLYLYCCPLCTLSVQHHSVINPIPIYPSLCSLKLVPYFYFYKSELYRIGSEKIL
jgi:hypothetical protein